MKEGSRAAAALPQAEARSDSGAAWGAATLPLRASLSGLYGTGARLHRRLGRAAAARAGGRPGCVVVSVGGLTVGGAGKTPLAAALARGLHERGFRVALASRGYRGSGREPVQLVSDGARIHSDVARSGDESLLLAAHAPGVPVWVGRDRRVVAHHAVATFDAEIVVLDDGFQHHRLARDRDLVCVDGTAGFGNGHVLPWGPLREPIGALRFADWLCVVDPLPDGAWPEAVLRFAASGRPVLQARRRPRFLTSLDHRVREPLSSLRGRAVGLLAGVARPGSLRRTLESLGARVVAERVFADHHAYRARDLRGLGLRAREWVTTEKDALKILPHWLEGVKLSVLGIEMELEQPEAFFDPIRRLVLRRRASSGPADSDPRSRR